MIKFVPKYNIQEFSSKKWDTLLIIPVINEGNRIIDQLRSIQSFKYPVDIAIADGGSTDSSLSDSLKIASLGVSSILTKVGTGNLSSQLLMGFDYALQNGYLNVITMDGNGKDDPKGIPTIEAALTSGFDFVQGSRFIDGGSAINTPAIRNFAIRWIHAPITSVAAGRKFTDTTNGFRGFSNHLLQNEDIDIFRDCFKSYELLFYIPIRASRLGFLVCEKPVTRAYPKNGPIPTKIKGFTSYVVLMRILIKAAFGGYNPKGH